MERGRSTDADNTMTTAAPMRTPRTVTRHAAHVITYTAQAPAVTYAASRPAIAEARRVLVAWWHADLRQDVDLEGRQPYARPTLWLRPRPRIRCVSFAGDDPNSLPNEVMIKNWTKAFRSFRWETGCRPPRGHVGNVLRVTLLARTIRTRVAPAAAAELGPREPESAALLASSGVRWPDVLFTCRRTAASIDLRSLLKLVLIYSPHGLMPLPTHRPTITFDVEGQRHHRQCEVKEGVHPDQQRLILEGKQPEDG